MAKKSPIIHIILNFVAWITGIIVSLSVALAMIEGTLSLPRWLGGKGLALFAGWIVIITTVLGLILAIIDYLS
ncbi:MAG: hypothetical protein AABX03_00540 [Nanoarchaeota archaeon]